MRVGIVAVLGLCCGFVQAQQLPNNGDRTRKQSVDFDQADQIKKLTVDQVTPSPNLDPDLVRESSCPDWGWKGFSDEEATQCRADRGLASAG